MVELNSVVYILAFSAVLLCLLALILFWFVQLRKPVSLSRVNQNPVLSPDKSHWWESEAVFNPAAVYHEGRVHLFYRAMGPDGISRIGHASSADGMHFDERTPYPVFDEGPGFVPPEPKGKLTYKTLSYDTVNHASGGGWGGVEDPRAVNMNGRIYLTFEAFHGWQAMHLGVTSITHGELDDRNWNWSKPISMSPKGEVHKNWVLFPEKINGKFAILHALTPRIMVDYVDTLESLNDDPIKSNNQRSGRKGKWDAFIRGAGAPPIKTEQGWLLLYHGMNPEHGAGYNVGAMLLDLNDPTKILAQSDEPILRPEAWYENDWKPGVVYATGAVVVGKDLFVYYGGGDKYIAAATIDMREFLRKLMNHESPELAPVAVK